MANNPIFNLFRGIFDPQFLKEQFLVWWRVVGSPASAIATMDLKAPASALKALRFATFVYAATLIVALPQILIAYGLDLTGVLKVLAVDCVLTMFPFAMLGWFLHLAARPVRGHGTLQQSLLAGVYLVGFWPIVQCMDYPILASPYLTKLTHCLEQYSPSSEVTNLTYCLEHYPGGDLPKVGPTFNDFVCAGFFVLLLSSVLSGWLREAVPAMKHVHQIGRGRAWIAAALGLFAFLVTYAAVILPLIDTVLGYPQGGSQPGTNVTMAGGKIGA